MVFPGHFSTGCSRCRLRKVKCDERKPSCRRCYIYGKPCPGYSDQFQFRYRKGAAAKKAGQAVKTAPPSSASDASSTSWTSQSPPQTDRGTGQNDFQVLQEYPWQPRRRRRTPPAARVTVPTVLAPSIEHMSMTYFVRRFVSPGCADSYPGHLTFLPSLLDCDHHGVLEQATLCVAQIAAFNQFGGSQLLQHAYKNHGLALRGLRDVIDAGSLATDDRTLATVLLLCTFIDVSGESAGDPRCHASGLYYLLEARGPEQLATERGFELFVLALIRLQVYSMVHNDNSYTDPCGLAELLGLFDPLMRAMYMVSRTLGYRHALFKIAMASAGVGVDSLPNGSLPPKGVSGGKGEDPSLLDEESLLRVCFETLEEFDTWDANAASYWKSTWEGRTEPTMLGDVGANSRHYDPETACTIILVRSSRLILLVSLLEYHEIMCRAEFPTQTTQLFAEYVPFMEQNIRSTISDMLNCVPYALGDLDPTGQKRRTEYDGAGGLIILQPMRLVTYCPYSSPEQVAASQEILRRINTTMGVRSAVSWEGWPSMDQHVPDPKPYETKVMYDLAGSGNGYVQYGQTF